MRKFLTEMFEGVLLVLSIPVILIMLIAFITMDLVTGRFTTKNK
jgi:hypothetical protein